MIRLESLKNYVFNNRVTLLGIGPMSLNVVDAAIELSNAQNFPLILIASRRQVEARQFGGGYVNSWDTQSFAKYVRSKSTSDKLFLARDHGGPWQGEFEVKGCYSYAQALESAKVSYAEDIDSGFEILHIDPNRAGPNGEPPADLPTFISRTIELIAFCHEYAARQGRVISFEIGTDEGLIGDANVDEIQQLYHAVSAFCQSEKIPQPDFLVMTTGTKVMETRNVGTLPALLDAGGEIPSTHVVPKMVSFCRANNMLLKEHNADYLSAHCVAWHPQQFIHSANVAPEFGVVETCAMLGLMEQFNLNSLRDDFIELANASGKFQKWLLPDTTANDLDRAVIAGHYLFSTQEYQEIKNAVQRRCEKSGIDLDSHLKDAIKASIQRYTHGFGLSSLTPVRYQHAA